jgi:VWFA-related protein
MRSLLISLFTFVAVLTLARGQTRPQEQPPEQDDVIRVNTDLVQTEVTVVDKQGHFVEGLQREQFELRVDGQPQPIGFFERVVAGSEKEKQLAAARENSNVDAAKPAPGKFYKGRTVIFFMDDLHLSLQSVGRTRQMLQNFIEKEMQPGDLVAIASSSGRIGFLQQFTDNKAVLRAAVARFNHYPYVVQGYGTGNTQMSEYMALTIETKSDSNVFGYFVQECQKQSSAPKNIPRAAAAIRMTCETQVKNSARAILTQAASIINNTYSSLETLMRSSQRLPGRKLVFFISDGFLLDTGPRNNSPFAKLGRITDAALRAGVVIYTIDARGLFSGMTEASNGLGVDSTGLLANSVQREATANQDALNALAADTGGRALRNQNSFDGWVEQALDETSNYYLLAWRPETETQKDEKFRKVEVSVAGRPELTVRLPRGYIGGAKAAVTPAATSKSEKPAKANSVKTPETEIFDALSDPNAYPKDSLPTLLSLSYLDTPSNGMVLTSSMQVASGVLTFGDDGRQPASVDIAGVVLNDKGKVEASFKNRLGVKPLSAASTQPDTSNVIYNHRAQLKPGIYQVRVAARDEKSGRVGSARQWVEIPDLSTRRLTLSSLLLGGQVVEKSQGAAAQSEPQVQFSVDHHFSHSSHLNFWVFIYNAARSSAGTPDLTTQVQLLREGREVVNSPQRKLQLEGTTDLVRIPYGGDVALKSLGAGRYELRLNITDNIAKTTASQSIWFVVE